jgi:hypothetical protein
MSADSYVFILWAYHDVKSIFGRLCCSILNLFSSDRFLRNNELRVAERNRLLGENVGGD